MNRRDWLMLLLGFKGTGDTVALDPVRVQKGMFLLAQEGGIPEDERYTFEPYHYGPYSFELKRDLNELVRSGLAAAHPVSGYSWHRYHLTKAGIEQARALARIVQ